MKVSKIHQYIKKLKKEIAYHNYRYYVLSNPIISDIEFDNKIKLLEVFENKIIKDIKNYNSPTQNIGSSIDINDVSVLKTKHITPMYSLKNIHSRDDLIHWVNNIQHKHIYFNNKYVCEPKYDGVSVNVIYKDGVLKQALTRGDGLQGEDITDKIISIKNIPNKLNIFNNNYIEIRGELVISNDNLKKLNINRHIKKKKINIFYI